MKLKARILLGGFITTVAALSFLQIAWIEMRTRRMFNFGRTTTLTTTDLLAASIRPDSDRRSNPLILVWRKPWGVVTEGPKEGMVGICQITYNRSKIQDASSVLFHYSALDQETMPWIHYRHPDQVFVFQTLESPTYVQLIEHRDFKNFDGDFINWTMSYRGDSDVFSPYMTLGKDFLLDGKRKVQEILAKKKNVALWVVSNCDLLPGSRNRMEYSNALIAAGLPLSRYGHCFNNSDELENLSEEYLLSFKFYLAFENAIGCKDYLTEKFWANGIGSGRVPVVLGPSKEDVLKLAPLNSFIHASDFATASHLVDHLMLLDKDQAAYEKYFEWRVNPSAETLRILNRYRLVKEELLCSRLSRPFAKKSYKYISKIFFDEEPIECLPGEVL